MKYRLAGGNVAAADFDICNSVLHENGLSVSEAIRNLFSYIARTKEVPDAVRLGEHDATAQRMAAFQEINALVDAERSVPWENDSRESLRDILESRYV